MKASLHPTNHCKICFKEIKDNSFHNLFFRRNDICEDCFNKFQPKFIHFKHGKVKCLSIYHYDLTIKDLLYKYKGCYDIELKSVFLSRYLWYLRLKYYGYKVITLPSYYLDDERRGFNHVKEIAKLLKLPLLEILEKTKDHKQADQNFEGRKKIGKVLKLSHLELIKNQKILIMDDVHTTGSSIDAAINLIKEGKPKKIEVLVVAKNELKKD